MRDPKQEARRIPHAFTDDADGIVVVLYHEADGQIKCPPGKGYGEATANAEKIINEKYPGRSL